MVTEKKHFLIIFFLLPLLFSCVSSRKSAHYDDSFFEETKKDFYEKSLQNNIQVYVKNIPREKNISLRIVFSGGASVNDKPGLEQFTLSYLKNGSKNFPVEYLKRLRNRGECFLESECYNDYSCYGVTSPAVDFDNAFTVFCDTLFSPDLSEENFRQYLLTMTSSSMDKSENPWWLLLRSIYSEAYKDTPYAKGVEYFPETNVTASDFMGQYIKLLNSSRMQIFAAGNFSLLAKNSKKKGAVEEGVEYFYQKLVQGFGGLKGTDFSRPPVKELNFTSEKNIVVESEFSHGKINAALCYNAPSRNAPDYEAFAAATIILDSILQKELVKTGIVSKSGTGVINGRESLSVVMALDGTDYSQVIEGLKNAVKSFPDESGINDGLFLIKNLYIKKIIASLSDDELSINQMISSRLYHESITAYLSRPEKIYQLTAKEISDAYEKYFGDAFAVSVVVK